ncbi:MAG: polysaccharide biosynthesis C-terminal domain-containing protein [Ignavibacteria bacterium]
MYDTHIKKLLSQTVIYGIGIALNRAVSLILIPLYTYYFSTDELGLLNLVQSLWFFIILFYIYGTETSFIKKFIDAKNHTDKAQIYSTTLLLLTITSILFSVILYLIAPTISKLFVFKQEQEATFLLQILSFLLFFDTLFRFPLLLLRAEMKPTSYLLLNIISLILNVSLNFVFILVLHYNIESIFYSYIISVFITFLLGLILTKKYLKLTFSFKRAIELISYGNKFIYIGVFLLLIEISDRFFLKYYFDESIVGIYSTSYRLASVMSLLIAAFKFSWTPYFLNLSNDTNNKEVVARVFTSYVYIGLFMFLLFSFYTEPIVSFPFWGFSFLNANFQSGLVIVPLILLSHFFSGLYSNMNVAPFFTEKTFYLLFSSFVGFIINFVLNILLIPHFGMVGAAFVTLFTYIIMFLVIYYFSQQIYIIQYQWKKLAILALLSVICFSAHSLVKLLTDYKLISLIIDFILLAGYITFASKLGIAKLSTITNILMPRLK